MFSHEGYIVMKAGLGWAGLGFAGLGWVGWARLGWLAGLRLADWVGLGWAGRDGLAGLGWAGLCWTGMGWAGRLVGRLGHLQPRGAQEKIAAPRPTKNGHGLLRVPLQPRPASQPAQPSPTSQPANQPASHPARFFAITWRLT